jgi:hypothetical protein
VETVLGAGRTGHCRGMTPTDREVLIVSGIAYAAIALLTLVSPSVRGLRRAAVPVG